jgi:CBS domain-containing protein
MTAEPITATVSMPRDTAAILMAEHHIAQLPVVDGEQPVGILRARGLVPTDTSHDERTAPIGLGL